MFRNIDKAGSLDNYILYSSDKELQSDIAVDLKIEMLDKLLRLQRLKPRDGTEESNDRS